MKLTTTLLLGAVTLTGCTTKIYTTESLPPLPTVTTTTTATSPLQFGQVSESEYLSAVRRESTAARLLDDDILLATGKATCVAFDAGLSAEQVSQTIIDNMGTTPESAQLMIASASLATVYLCPQHVGKWAE